MNTTPSNGSSQNLLRVILFCYCSPKELQAAERQLRERCLVIGAFNHVKRFDLFLKQCECAADLLLIVFKGSNPLKADLERIEALDVETCPVKLDDLDYFSGHFDEATDEELPPDEYFFRKIDPLTREFSGTYYALRWKLIWDSNQQILTYKKRQRKDTPENRSN